MLNKLKPLYVSLIMIIIVNFCILCLIQHVQCQSKSHDLTSECSLNPTSFTLVQQSLNMKAIRVGQFGGPEVLKYETNVPLPTIGKQDVLVRVKAVGIYPVEIYSFWSILSPSRDSINCWRRLCWNC